MSKNNLAVKGQEVSKGICFAFNSSSSSKKQIKRSNLQKKGTLLSRIAANEYNKVLFRGQEPVEI